MLIQNRFLAVKETGQSKRAVGYSSCPSSLLSFEEKRGFEPPEAGNWSKPLSSCSPKRPSLGGGPGLVPSPTSCGSRSEVEQLSGRNLIGSSVPVTKDGLHQAGMWVQTLFMLCLHSFWR